MDKRRISQTALSGITVEVLNKIAPLIILFVIQRRLGVNSFGYAMFGISMVELFLPLVVFGYSHYGSLKLAHLKNQPVAAGEFVCDILSLRLIHATILTAALIAVTFLVPSYFDYQNMAMSLSFAFFAGAFEVMWVFMAIQKMAVFNMFIGVGRLLSLILILALVISPADGLLFAILSLLSNALINLFTAVLIFRQFPLRKPSLTRMKNILKMSLSFALILALTGFLDRIDILLVEQTAGLKGTGLYAGPARIAHSLSQVANAIILTFFSEMVILKSTDAFRRHLSLGTFSLISYCAPVVSGSFFVAKEMLVFLFGSEYADVSNILAGMLLSMSLGVFILAFGMQILVLKNKRRYLTLSLLAGASTASLAALYLSESYGLLGIVWGVFSGKALSLILIFIKVHRMMGFLPWTEALRGAAPAMLMSVVFLVYHPDHFLLTIALGVTVCLISMILINRKQIGELRSAWKKQDQ